jgi:hypothetical protein
VQGSTNTPVFSSYGTPTPPFGVATPSTVTPTPPLNSSPYWMLLSKEKIYADKPTTQLGLKFSLDTTLDAGIAEVEPTDLILPLSVDFSITDLPIVSFDSGLVYQEILTTMLHTIALVKEKPGGGVVILETKTAIDMPHFESRIIRIRPTTFDIKWESLDINFSWTYP